MLIELTWPKRAAPSTTAPNSDQNINKLKSEIGRVPASSAIRSGPLDESDFEMLTWLDLDLERPQVAATRQVAARERSKGELAAFDGGRSLFVCLFVWLLACPFWAVFASALPIKLV